MVKALDLKTWSQLAVFVRNAVRYSVQESLAGHSLSYQLKSLNKIPK